MKKEMKKYIEERPWGKFEQFCQNEIVTVKILLLNPNQELSLQYHLNRDEFWRIIDGNAIIRIGDETKIGKKGDEFFIKRETNHQIIAQDKTVSILEIAFGEFNELDIIRISDKYNRV